MASSKSKLTEAQLTEGVIDSILGTIMKGRLKKIEPILKNASPELARQAKKADEARQEYEKARKAMYKALNKKDVSTADLRKSGKLF